MTEEYNGYTNYETWGFNLMINNDQYIQEYAYNLLKQAYEKAKTEKYLKPVHIFERELEDWAENIRASVFHPHVWNCKHCCGLKITDARLFCEQVGSFHRVNYREIAEMWVEEYEQENAA